MASDRRDDPELREVRADRIDHRSLLADEQVPGTVQRQAALLLRRLGRDEPHVRSGDRLADRFGVSGIVLVPHIGLHIGRRHQTYGVAKRLELARPMMRVEAQARIFRDHATRSNRLRGSASASRSRRELTYAITSLTSIHEKPTAPLELLIIGANEFCNSIPPKAEIDGRFTSRLRSH